MTELLRQIRLHYKGRSAEGQRQLRPRVARYHSKRRAGSRSAVATGSALSPFEFSIERGYSRRSTSPSPHRSRNANHLAPRISYEPRRCPWR